MSRRTIELQYRTRSRKTQTATGEALCFGFSFGPLEFFVIAGLPEPGNDTPLVYVKARIIPAGDWSFFQRLDDIPRNNSKG